MFGISGLGKENITRKSITRKYKNARITILDAKYKKLMVKMYFLMKKR